MNLHFITKASKVFTFYRFFILFDRRLWPVIVWYVTEISQIYKSCTCTLKQRTNLPKSYRTYKYSLWMFNSGVTFNSLFYLHCWIDLPPSQTRIPVVPWRSVKVYMVSKMLLKNTYLLMLRDISYIYVFCTFCLIRTIWSWNYQIIIFIEWICSAFWYYRV